MNRIKTMLVTIILGIALLSLATSVSAECIDADADTWDACIGYSTPVPGCDDPCDCMDGQASINPGESEVCDDAIDNDCDALTDDADPDCMEYSPTSHLVSFQGYATDSGGDPLSTGDLKVEIYETEIGGTPYWENTYSGAIEEGIFDVLLGSSVALNLDNTKKYWMEIDINGQEVVGNLAGGRQEFWPGSGSHFNLQKRVTGTCPGEVMVAINEDGTVSCETDDVNDAVASCSDVDGCNHTGSVRHFEWMGSIKFSGNIYDNGWGRIQAINWDNIFRLWCWHPDKCTYVYYLNGTRTGGILGYTGVVAITLPSGTPNDVRFYFAKKTNGMDMLVCDVFDTDHPNLHFICHDTT